MSFKKISVDDIKAKAQSSLPKSNFRRKISEDNRHLIFRLNAEYLSLRVELINEVVDLTEIIKIPKLSKKFKGICNLRGEIVPIIDIEHCIFSRSLDRPFQSDTSKKASTPSGIIKAIFVKGTDESFGFIVDELCDILELNETNYTSAPSTINSQIPLKFISNVAQIEERTILEIDFQKIMKENFSLYEGYFEDASQIKRMKKEDQEEVEKREVADVSNIPVKISNPIIHQNSISANKTLEHSEIIDQQNTNGTSTAEARKKYVRFELSEDQLDAFREIASISTAKMADGLASLLEEGAKINIDIKKVGVEELTSFHERNTQKEELYFGVRSELSQGFDGVVLLLISLEGVQKLFKKITMIENFPTVINSLEDLDEDSSSAVAEIGNIIVSHYVMGISNFLKLKMYHGIPQVAIAEYSILVENEIVRLMSFSDRAICSETSIIIDGEKIDGNILFMPYFNSIDVFISYLDPDRIFELLDAESIRENRKTKETAAILREENPPKKDINMMEHVISQQDFEISQTILDELKLSTGDLDACRELGNMAAAKAGNMLSDKLHNRVFLKIPPATIMSIQDLATSFSTENKKIIGYVGRTEGIFEGNVFLLYQPDDLTALLNKYLQAGYKKKIRKKSDITPVDLEHFEKILQKLGNKYYEAVFSFLKLEPVEPSYKFLYQSPRAIFESMINADLKDTFKVIMVETSIFFEAENSMKGRFILILGEDKIHGILERIMDVWG